MRRTLLLAIALSWPACTTLNQALYDTSTETRIYVVPEKEVVAGAKQAGPPPGEAEVAVRGCGPFEAAASWSVKVIRLKHAKAEELAETLSQILPPGITVVPDPRTNSLIISTRPSPTGRPSAPE